MNKYWKYDVFAVVFEIKWNKEREKKKKNKDFIISQRNCIELNFHECWYKDDGKSVCL